MMGLIADAVLQKARHHGTGRPVDRGPDGVVIEGPGAAPARPPVVIAAGAHSRDLARQAGDRIPLDTERGYHVEWDMATPLLSRPDLPHRTRVLFLPDGRAAAGGGDGRAGRVDPAAVAAPGARLVEGARAFFPDLGEPDREWMGFRPSLPDSLPVIGPSAAGAEVIHAFGHGHLGITMAPITARIVADLVADRATGIDIRPLRPARF
jgi:glycine/D-amino acid oxidase-like deaminating enzyme